jgi:tetratricopeptide (TPR) repeat protein
MRASVCVLLLVLTSRVCAQSVPPPQSLVPVDPSHLPMSKPGSSVSVGELLIPDKARKELRRAQSALQSGDARSSARHLEKALQIYPNYLEGHNGLGARYIELHEYEKAAAEFQKAIDIDSRVMAPINNLSVALFQLQRYPDAEAAARRAHDLDPQNSTARYMLGAILVTEDRNPEEAMELLRPTKSEYPDAYLLLAKILERRGNLEEAKKELRDYLELPGAEKRQNAERWLARLGQESARTSKTQPKVH